MTSPDLEPRATPQGDARKQQDQLRSPTWLMLVIVGLFVALLVYGIFDR